MSDLKEDPEARALRPQASRGAILNALIAGVLAGIAIAALAWSYGSEPVVDRDAGIATPSFTLDSPEEDRGEAGSPWIEEPPATPIEPDPTIAPGTDPAAGPTEPAQPSDQPPSTVNTAPLK